MKRLIDAILFPFIPLLEWWEGLVFWVVFLGLLFLIGLKLG